MFLFASRLCLIAVSTLVMPTSGQASADDDTSPKIVIDLKDVVGGAMRRLRTPLMRSYKMTKEMPIGLRKGIDAPSAMYGLLPTSIHSNGIFVGITESDDSQTGQLFLDLNADGDLSNDLMPNDAESKWIRRGPVAFEAEVELKGESGPIRLRFYRYAANFAKDQPSLQEQGNPLFIHRDDAREGSIVLNGIKTTIMLKELSARGHYDNLEPAQGLPAVALFVDRNRNGEYDREYEQYDLSQPFTIEGTTYELDNVSPDGSRLVLRKSSTTAPEVPMPLDFVGQLVPKFKAKLLSGEELHFPEDLKGKIVFLDFWATWCGPCMSKKPDLVRIYERLKDRNLEFVGVCLDGSEDRERIGNACDKLGMTWPQLFDGQVWGGEVAKLYGVTSLPTAMLIDGTTGRLLATPSDLKEESIGKLIDRVLVIRDSINAR